MCRKYACAYVFVSYCGLIAIEKAWYIQILAHKMASESVKLSEEKVSQNEEKTELKKHRGIPEALFLVSIYRFAGMGLLSA